MLLTLLFTTCLLTTLDTDYTDIEITFLNNLTLNVNTLYPDLLLYLIIESTSADMTGENTSDTTSDIAVFVVLNGIISFSPIIGGCSSEASFNAIEAIIIIITSFTCLFVVGLDGLLNEAYSSTTASWLWPFFTLLESLTVLLRGLSLTIRLTSNTIAGHIISSLLLLNTILTLEFATFWVIPIITILLLFITLGVQVMELIVTLIQVYVWCILSVVYEDVIN